MVLYNTIDVISIEGAYVVYVYMCAHVYVYVYEACRTWPLESNFPMYVYFSRLGIDGGDE